MCVCVSCAALITTIVLCTRSQIHLSRSERGVQVMSHVAFGILIFQIGDRNNGCLVVAQRFYMQFTRLSEIQVEDA